MHSYDENALENIILIIRKHGGGIRRFLKQ